MSDAKRLVLIDGHALAYRAYFALMRSNFSTKDGRPTGAVYGFTRMILEIIRRQKPECMAVSFDRPKATFRHEAFEGYKAQRKPMADDLISQMQPLRDVVKAFDIPVYELDGYEADDVIGTIATQASAKGYEVLIVTGDRDAFQLVDANVRVLLPTMGVSELEVFGPAEVEAKMGVRPDQIIHYKAIAGDSSDNIPGVPGIGDKGAITLLKEFGDLESIYANLTAVKGKTQDKLRDGEASARMSLSLATIDRHVPIDFNWEACHLTMPDLAKLTAVLEDLEFTSIIRQLPSTLAVFGAVPGAAPVPAGVGGGAKAASPTSGGLFDGLASDAAPVVTVARPLDLQVTIVDTPELLAELGEAMAQATSFTYDTETDSLNSVQCKIVGLAIAVGGPEAKDCRCFYVPVGHDEGKQLGWEQVRQVVAPHFADPAKGKVAHNAKFDLNVLCRHGLACGGVTFDTMIADYLVYSGRASHALKELAWEHLRYEQTEIKALIGTGAKAITMAQVSIEKAAPYAAADVAVTTELRAFLEPKLTELNQARLFAEVELPLIEVLVAMEQHGVKLDTDYMKGLSVRLGDRIKALETKIHEMAGEAFNINSPKQLSVILFEKLQLPVVKRTKTGPSTDASVLEELSASHEIVRELLEYRQLVKLKGTYVDAIPELVNPRTGRVHTSYNQTVAATGRLSSQDPNLQNIPIRTQEGREIRRAFLPSQPGWVILSADYSQIELRILAHVTQDPVFLDAFRRDLDIHTVTAAQVFGVPIEAVTSDMRRKAKTTNFGIIYGQSEFGLARTLNIPRKEAKEFIDKFNEQYAGVRHYLIGTLAAAKRQGYVETLSGRRRYIPEVTSSNGTLRQFGERMAINAPIQGTAADIIKIAMVQLYPRLEGLPVAMLLQVHDELVFEVDPARLEEVTAIVKDTMEGAFQLDVPLRVDVHAGASWMEAK
ncbi:MAG: DNA polymerase I [Candidatus Sericytochromatia bacterium]